MTTDRHIFPTTAVKFCGFTSEEDALAALAAGAHALGFNGYLRSKRYLDLLGAAPWIRELPPFGVRVAVLVNPTLAEVEKLAATQAFDAVQLHGDESAEFCQALANLGPRLIKALPLATMADLEAIPRYAIRDILLDAAAAPGVYGGTGQVIDWGLARQAVERFPEKRIILSGGLHAGNVAAAVEQVQPYAVDTASGIEVLGNPRQKSLERMRDFTRALRPNP